MKVGDYDNGIDPAGEDYPKWMALVDHLKVSLLTCGCRVACLPGTLLVDRSVYVQFCFIMIDWIGANIIHQFWNFTYVHHCCCNVCKLNSGL